MTQYPREPKALFRVQSPDDAALTRIEGPCEPPLARWGYGAAQRKENTGVQSASPLHVRSMLRARCFPMFQQPKQSEGRDKAGSSFSRSKGRKMLCVEIRSLITILYMSSLDSAQIY